MNVISIQISTKTKEMLDRLKTDNETYDDIIKKYIIDDINILDNNDWDDIITYIRHSNNKNDIKPYL